MSEVLRSPGNLPTPEPSPLADDILEHTLYQVSSFIRREVITETDAVIHARISGRVAEDIYHNTHSMVKVCMYPFFREW